MFSTFSETNFKFSVTITLSSANTFNLDRSKILSFGTELKWPYNIYIGNLLIFELSTKFVAILHTFQFQQSFSLSL